MRNFGHLEYWLWLSALAIATALLFRMWREQLHIVYRYFSLYVLIDVVHGVWSLVVVSRDFWYATSYLAFQAVKCLLYIMVVLELYSLALRQYPGIATTARRAMQIVLAIATAVSAGLSYFEVIDPLSRSVVLNYLHLIERTVVATLAFFLILISVFLAWFPLRLSRNQVYYMVGLVTYFLAKSAALLALNIAGRAYTGVVSTAMLVVFCGCFLFWLVVLSREGEKVPMPSGPRRDALDEQSLIRQLDSINSSLLRTAKVRRLIR